MPVIRSHDITLHGGNDEYSIILRPLCDEHLPLLCTWNADPEVLYWAEGGEDVARSYGEETVRNIYGSVSQHALCFLIEVDGTPIGECWLQKMNLPDVISMYPGLDVRRIDMAIGEKAYWGKGIGTAFVHMLVDLAFTTENVDVLHCLCEDYNIRSQRVWLKNGFKLVRADELVQPQKGKVQYHYALTREEYTQKGAMQR
jgi:RimJ/RimL family protein N-acetyltransferase